MWVIWALIICGGVCWDPADCFRLQNNAEGTFCATVGWSDEKHTFRMAKCKAGQGGDDAADAQTWLWEGKKLKNKLSGRCLGTLSIANDNRLERCKYVDNGYESSKQAGIENHRNRTEFTRFGKHGLKASNGKCLKISRNGLPGFPGMRFSDDCEEDKDDPYYE
jgi:hypothetical protein